MNSETMNCSTKMLGRFVMIACGMALCVPLLEWCFEPQAAFGGLVADYFFSLAYAFSIGGLLSAAMPVIWKRSSKWQWTARWPARVLAIAVGNALGCLVSGLVPLAFYGHRYAYWPSYVGSFKIGLILSAATVAFLVTYERMRAKLHVSEMELKTKDLERQRALKLATDARLSSLESRVHPHFLFNTINSVSSLIPEDPKRAERILVQMANLLRFSLDSVHAGLVPLEREVKILEDYLEIERARFGERLRYQIGIPSELNSACVPPLALQTLAENSVKYAVSARRQGATIRIRGKAEEASLVLEVSDDGPGFQPIELPSGHGLNNLRERLAVLFGERAMLDIASTSEGTSVRLRMPLVVSAPASAAPLVNETGERVALGA
ncbi:MAG TPA: sensor histidine kinase [Bryobacteraceae bacterium]|jgi:sensor histidine kinase YesM|nr:sensor histidine kinase [Bryobacteraceae bacterium]